MIIHLVFYLPLSQIILLLELSYYYYMYTHKIETYKHLFKPQLEVTAKFS